LTWNALPQLFFGQLLAFFFFLATYLRFFSWFVTSATRVITLSLYSLFLSGPPERKEQLALALLKSRTSLTGIFFFFPPLFLFAIFFARSDPFFSLSLLRNSADQFSSISLVGRILTAVAANADASPVLLFPAEHYLWPISYWPSYSGSPMPSSILSRAFAFIGFKGWVVLGAAPLLPLTFPRSETWCTFLQSMFKRFSPLEASILFPSSRCCVLALPPSLRTAPAIFQLRPQVVFAISLS